MSVAVTTRRRRRGVRAAQVRADAQTLLRALAVDAELSVALVSDVEMRDLNFHYRHKDQTTDVLSFGLEGAPAAPAGVPAQLGDVVISVDTAARQAKARGVSVADELRLLLTHGVLHLLGYDHERSPAEARRMFARQRRLIALLRGSGGPTRLRRR